MPQSRASFTSVLRAVCATLILLVQTHSCGGQPQVIGPQKIVAMLGDDVILPCHLEPVMDAVSMMLEWARPDLTPRFVFVWLNRQEMLDKHPSYKGRTSVSIDELKQGNISLRLSNVTLSDEGKYRCSVPKLDTQTNIELVVGWYPEPEVLWLDAEGNIVSAGPTETLRGPDGLYTVRSSVTVINKHAKTFTCKLQGNKTNQTRETQIHIQDDFFMVSCQAVGSNAIVVITCLLILPVCFVVWEYRQTKPKGTDGREGEKEQLIKEIQKNKDVELEKKRLEQENKDLKTEQANVAKQLQDMAGKRRPASEETKLTGLNSRMKELKSTLMRDRDRISRELEERERQVEENKTKLETVESDITERIRENRMDTAQDLLKRKQELSSEKNILTQWRAEMELQLLRMEKRVETVEEMIDECSGQIDH